MKQPRLRGHDLPRYLWHSPTIFPSIAVGPSLKPATPLTKSGLCRSPCLVSVRLISLGILLLKRPPVTALLHHVSKACVSTCFTPTTPELCRTFMPASTWSIKNQNLSPLISWLIWGHLATWGKCVTLSPSLIIFRSALIVCTRLSAPLAYPQACANRLMA